MTFSFSLYVVSLQVVLGVYFELRTGDLEDGKTTGRLQGVLLLTLEEGC